MEHRVAVILNIITTGGTKLQMCILNLSVHFSYQPPSIYGVALKLELVKYE